MENTFKNKKSMLLGALCLVLMVNMILPGFSYAKEEEFVIHMLAVEFKGKTEDGKEIEAYRWDPGTVFVPEGKEVTLSIYGVKVRFCR